MVATAKGGLKRVRWNGTVNDTYSASLSAVTRTNLPPGVVENKVPPGVVLKSVGICDASLISTIRVGIDEDLGLIKLGFASPDISNILDLHAGG